MELLTDRTRARNRTLGLAGALALHALVIALLLLLSAPHQSVSAPAEPGLIAVPLTEPPPPPPPPPADDIEEGAAAPPSRGADEAPSPPEPPAPLARPTPAEVSPDPGSESGAGLGAAAGSGAGQGGEGEGSGAGLGGGGRGAGTITPPVRIAGALTDADYERTRPPRGAGGTVVIGFRVTIAGRAEGCHVVRSSGYEILDRTTCRLVEQRFRFRPAQDSAGRSIVYNLRTDFTWRPR